MVERPVVQRAQRKSVFDFVRAALVFHRNDMRRIKKAMAISLFFHACNAKPFFISPISLFCRLSILDSHLTNNFTTQSCR